MNTEKILNSSLLEEIRIKRTPKNNPLRGYWTGERGNSKFIPTNNQDEIIKILNEYNQCGIEYKEGIINLNPCSIARVSLDKMYIIRYKILKIVTKYALIYGIVLIFQTSMIGQTKRLKTIVNNILIVGMNVMTVFIVNWFQQKSTLSFLILEELQNVK